MDLIEKLNKELLSKGEKNNYSKIEKEVKCTDYANIAIYVRTDSLYEACNQEGKLIRMLDNIGNINISIYRETHGNSLLSEIIDNIVDKNINLLLVSNLSSISENLILLIEILKLAELNNVDVISYDNSVEEFKTLKIYKEYEING